MAAETIFFRDLAYVFGAAVVGGGVAKLLRQPLILGYVLGGFLIGPFTPGPTLSEVHQFEVLAELGVILLMYSIGLEFSFERASSGEVGGDFRRSARNIAFRWSGRSGGRIDGLGHNAGNGGRRRCFRGQHHGALPFAGRPRRPALAARHM